MMETVQAFIGSINERKHVLQLIENTVLTIELMMKDERISLYLKKGEVYIADSPGNAASDCKISGDKLAVNALIFGREKLRTLLRRGELQCSASFRTILLLESFFYLGKTDLFTAKIS